jgi:dolichol kinase
MTSEKVKYGLENRELKLSFWEKVQHYGIVGFCFIIPATLTFMYLKDYFENSHKPIKSGEIWFLIIPALLGILFFYLQKSRLKFKEVNTNLNKSQLKKIIDKVAEELEWHIYKSNSKVILAKTHPGFLSGSWGEQITILFDNKKVLVNSVCDLDKKSSLVSMGRNGQNENKLIEEIKKASR